MKNKTLLQILLLLNLLPGSCLFAQVKVYWQKPLGGEGFETSSAALPTPDGGSLVVGQTNSTGGDVRLNHGQKDGWIVKLDAKGQVQWQKTIGGSEEDYLTSACLTSDGGFALCGYTESKDGDLASKTALGLDAWVIKLSPSGETDWSKTYDHTSSDFANSIKQTRDGGYIVAGSDVSDVMLMKLDRGGNQEWEQSYGGTSKDVGRSVEETSDGYVVLGSTLSADGQVKKNHGGLDIWMLGVNRKGELQWEKTFGGMNDDEGYALKKTNDGFVVCGNTFSAMGGTNYQGMSDYYVMKTNTAGEVAWKKTFGGAGNDYATSVDLAQNGGYVVSGYSSSTGANESHCNGMYDYWVVRLNGKGEVAWDKFLGGSDRDYASLVMQRPDGSYMIVGDSFSNSGDIKGNHGEEDIWVASFGPELAPEAQRPGTAVSAETREETADEAGEQPVVITGRLYPNPVSDLLTVETGLSGQLTYALYNSNGQQVWSQNTTQDRVQVDVSGMQSGVYILKVNTRENVQTHRVIIQH